MGANLSTATCFLPFNNTVTEDLIGKTEWEIVNNSYDPFCETVGAHPELLDKKVLYLYNVQSKTAPVYIRSKSKNIWNFGDQDFTISLWFRKINNDVEHTLFYFPGITFGFVFSVYGLSVGWNGATYIGGPGKEIYGIEFRWVHLAVIRHNGVITLYRDGKNVGQYNIGTASIGNNNDELRIGQWGVVSSGNDKAGGFDGFMSEFIIDIGHAWYTDEFTPHSFLNSQVINNLSLSS